MAVSAQWQAEEIVLTLPPPAAIANALYVKKVGDFIFRVLGLGVGSGGQFITSTVLVMTWLYQNPVNFLASTSLQPPLSFLIYLLIRLLLSVIVGVFFQSLGAFLMIAFIDNLLKILQVEAADSTLATIILFALAFLGLFDVGANFYSDATVLHYVTTYVPLIFLLVAIFTLCSVFGKTVGRFARTFGKEKLVALYGQQISYYQAYQPQLPLPADVRRFLDMQKKEQEATGLQRLWYDLFG